MRIGQRLMLIPMLIVAAVAQPQTNPAQLQLVSPLDTKLERFDIADAILRDGLSALSLSHVDGLHLGFEEIIRDRIQQDPWTQSPHFSIHLQGKTIRAILDELCKSDPRYKWSQDGDTIN